MTLSHKKQFWIFIIFLFFNLQFILLYFSIALHPYLGIFIVGCSTLFLFPAKKMYQIKTTIFSRLQAPLLMLNLLGNSAVGYAIYQYQNNNQSWTHISEYILLCNGIWLFLGLFYMFFSKD